jgi:hypothetical protein
MLTTRTAASIATGTVANGVHRPAIKEDSEITRSLSETVLSKAVSGIVSQANNKESDQLRLRSVMDSGNTADTSPSSHWTSSSDCTAKIDAGMGGSHAVSERLTNNAAAADLKILAFNMFFSLLVSSTKARPRKGRAPVTGGVSVLVLT